MVHYGPALQVRTVPAYNLRAAGEGGFQSSSKNPGGSSSAAEARRRGVLKLFDLNATGGFGGGSGRISSWGDRNELSGSARVGRMGFLQAIHKKINDGLGYPRELHMSGQMGLVSIEIPVDGHGVWVPRMGFRAKSANPYLKVYALRRLESLLAAPLEGTAIEVPKGFTLSVNIDFSPEPEADIYGKKRPTAYNGVKDLRLLFSRIAVVPRKGFKPDLKASDVNGVVMNLLTFDIDALFSRDVRRATREVDWSSNLQRYKDDPWFTRDVL